MHDYKPRHIFVPSPAIIYYDYMFVFGVAVDGCNFEDIGVIGFGLGELSLVVRVCRVVVQPIVIVQKNNIFSYVIINNCICIKLLQFCLFYDGFMFYLFRMVMLIIGINWEYVI
jgi:hypothetical protein